MTPTLLALLKVSVGALILAIGMGSTLADVGYLWRRPRLLLRSVFAMYVAVPIAAFVLAKALPVAPGVRAALLVLAVSAGAPLLPRKLSRLGSEAYVFSLVVTSSLLAIGLVPAWIALLSRHFGVAAELPARVVAGVVAKAFLLPLGVGMGLRALLPRLVERLADPLFAVAGVALGVAGLALLAGHLDLLLAARPMGIGALVALMAIAIAIGHALGGPDPDDRTALAIACATRHLGIAVLVAASFPGPRTAVLIAAYVVASAAVSIPYLQWRRRASPRDAGAADGSRGA